MKQYNAFDWYWALAGDASRVYSSAAGDYVPTNDPNFQSWTSDGTPPTSIDTEANLGAVLAAYYPGITRPVPAAVLAGYQQEHADDIFRHKLVKYLFILNNRVRVLEGNQPFTVAQARAYFRSIM